MPQIRKTGQPLAGQVGKKFLKKIKNLWPANFSPTTDSKSPIFGDNLLKSAYSRFILKKLKLELVVTGSNRRDGNLSREHKLDQTNTFILNWSTI